MNDQNKTNQEHEHQTIESARFEPEDEGLGIFDKLLPLWIAICIIVGLLLSQFVPGLSEAIDSWQIAGISIPIGICLFLMMYPAMLNLKSSELKKLGRNPKPIILTLFSNWIVAPLVGVWMAITFVGGNPQLVLAVILLSSSPCTAMVLVWGWMAKGNQEQNVITTSVNTITIILLYVPVVYLLVAIANITLEQKIPLDPLTLLISLVVFIGLPLVLGLISRKTLTNAKGQEWFDKSYRPAVGKIAILALLMTLIILFSLNGEVLITRPDLLLLITLPLLIGFAIVVGYNLLVTRLFKLRYREAIITVLIGSSSHFEIAIAVAVAMHGVGSIAALGTTMGLFWEVPVMISLIYFARFLGKRGFWKGYNETTTKYT
ncbi:MAG TPA: ACR3 family arsenite efflux transporter [Candidatus Nanopelagicaceae bacterium]|nr:ACR3 family arsenite efflux transporter [Candidatus Nanopelagicaceae bacterium]